MKRFYMALLIVILFSMMFANTQSFIAADTGPPGQVEINSNMREFPGLSSITQHQAQMGLHSTPVDVPKGQEQLSCISISQSNAPLGINRTFQGYTDSGSENQRAIIIELSYPLLIE